MQLYFIKFNEKEKEKPPGAPDRTPVENPAKEKKSPIGDPQPPEKKKKRMLRN
ncbi:MAG: hypothetical protein H0V66_07380 [Bdellovibrionales bacterium]|nr:hypothetical protein [Bdellovibrionales bacterium]